MTWNGGTEQWEGTIVCTSGPNISVEFWCEERSSASSSSSSLTSSSSSSQTGTTGTTGTTGESSSSSSSSVTSSSSSSSVTSSSSSELAFIWCARLDCPAIEIICLDESKNEFTCDPFDWQDSWDAKENVDDCCDCGSDSLIDLEITRPL